MASIEKIIALRHAKKAIKEPLSSSEKWAAALFSLKVRVSKKRVKKGRFLLREIPSIEASVHWDDGRLCGENFFCISSPLAHTTTLPTMLLVVPVK